MAGNLVSGTDNPIGIGLADIDPMTMAYELEQAVGEGRHLDAALLALGMAAFAKPAVKAARRRSMPPSPGRLRGLKSRSAADHRRSRMMAGARPPKQPVRQKRR